MGSLLFRHLHWAIRQLSWIWKWATSGLALNRSFVMPWRAALVVCFIYRYKAIVKPKFNLSFGGHLPGLNYITRTVDINGIQEPLSIARRFLALEIIPTYKFTNQISLGIYYLRGYGFQKHGPQLSNFCPCRVALLKLNWPVNRISVLIRKFIISRWMRSMVLCECNYYVGNT